MPWEGGEIYVAAVDTNGTEVILQNVNHVAGKKNQVSAAFPQWASKDTIFFTNDKSGYQNPWKYTLGATSAVPILAKPIEEDFSDTASNLGESFGAKLDAEGETLIFSAMRDGRTVLYVIHLKTGAAEELECPYVEAGHFQPAKNGSVVFIAGKSTEPVGVVLVNLTKHSKASFKTLKSTSSHATSRFSQNLISVPQPITINIPPQDEPLYMNYYPPTNPDYIGPEGEKRWSLAPANLTDC